MKRLWILLVMLLASWPALAQPVPVMKPSVQNPKPGQKVDLTFHVSEGNQKITDYETVHEKKCHLMLISADYKDFQHEHPVLDKTGTFTMKNVVFKRPGLYYVFFDVTPEGSKQILKRFDFKVQGQGEPLVLKEDMAVKTVGGVTAKLVTMPAPLKKGDAMLHFQLSRNGKPVTDIQPFMGAMGHVVALGKDGKPFLHIHPMESNDPHAGHEGMNHGGMDHGNMNHGGGAKAKPGEIIFHANFPEPGLYKVWGQFVRGKQMLIMPFTVRVS